MQINGLGLGHSTDSHQNANDIHSHRTEDKQVSGAVTPSQTMVTAQASVPYQTAVVYEKTVPYEYEMAHDDASIVEENPTESGNSVTDWLKKTLSEIKRILEKIWNGENGSDVTAASEAVPPPQLPPHNSYSSAVGDLDRKQITVWQKLRVQFEAIKGYLTRHFSFTNQNFFQGKEDQTKEELSSRSRYRKDNLEIDSALTDESHLMDSYNKKGEYSQLAGEMLPKGTKDLHL